MTEKMTASEGVCSQRSLLTSKSCVRLISSDFGALETALPRIQGFLTSLHQGSHGNFKITRYNFAKLVRVSAVLTMFTKGTVFNLDRAIHLTMMGYALMFVTTFSLLYYVGEPEEFEAHSLPVVMDIAEDLGRFCPFVFGLFTSIILQRWWALRTDSVGSICDHCVNISGILVSVGARVLYDQEDWDAFRASHVKIVKYGIASVSCIVMESRSQTGVAIEDKAHGLAKLVELEVLTQAERDILEKTTCHASCLWSWIQALSVELLEMMSVPAPNVNMLYQEVRQAMMGVHSVEYYLHTQLPFPYVHMITLLVNVNSLVISIVAGVQVAIELKQGRLMVCMFHAAKVCLLPVLYQGLLQICVFLSDPFGDDIIDFPVRQYQKTVAQACQDHLAARTLFEQRWAEGESPKSKSVFIRKLPPRPNIDELLAAPEPTAEAPLTMEKLDQRLEMLAQSTSSLAESVMALQEGLVQSNAGIASSAGSLQEQVKELASVVSTMSMGRASMPAAPLQGNQWGRPPQKESLPRCCDVQNGRVSDSIAPSAQAN